MSIDEQLTKRDILQGFINQNYRSICPCAGPEDITRSGTTVSTHSFHSFLISELQGCERPASRPSCIIPTRKVLYSMNRNVAELREKWLLSGKENTLAPSQNQTLNLRNQPVAWSLYWPLTHSHSLSLSLYIYIYIYTHTHIKQFIIILDLARVG